VTSGALATAPATSPRRGAVTLRALRSLARSPALLVLVGIAVLAIIAPLIARDPLAVGKAAELRPPSSAHPFGTDQFGLDVFARVLYGARVDLAVAFSAAALAVLVGMPLGAFAAYRGGAWDQVLLRVAESFQAFPALLLAMGVAAALGPSLVNLVLIIALVNVPVYIRLTRSAVLPLRNADYVLAARCAGNSDWRILRRHVLPNVAEVAVAQFSVNCAWAIQILAGLSFIGIGVRLPTPEWGAMVRAGTDYVAYGQWWVSLFPGLAVLVTVLALNQVADGIRRGERAWR
jgi:peptide/nickel transport system permease protein